MQGSDTGLVRSDMEVIRARVIQLQALKHGGEWGAAEKLLIVQALAEYIRDLHWSGVPYSLPGEPNMTSLIELCQLGGEGMEDQDGEWQNMVTDFIDMKLVPHLLGAEICPVHDRGELFEGRPFNWKPWLDLAVVLLGLWAGWYSWKKKRG
jgi:hypothetical protein